MLGAGVDGDEAGQFFASGGDAFAVRSLLFEMSDFLTERIGAGFQAAGLASRDGAVEVEIHRQLGDAADFGFGDAELAGGGKEVVAGRVSGEGLGASELGDFGGDVRGVHFGFVRRVTGPST